MDLNSRPCIKSPDAARQSAVPEEASMATRSRNELGPILQPTSVSEATQSACYLRVSTDTQSTDNQRPELVQMATGRGWSVARWYVDEAVSGRAAVCPAFDEMMADAKRGRFRVLLIWSLRADAPLDDLAALRQNADLAFHLVYVDAKILHGWPPPLRHTTACTIVGLRPPRAVAASRFIPSMIRRSEGAGQNIAQSPRNRFYRSETGRLPLGRRPARFRPGGHERAILRQFSITIDPANARLQLLGPPHEKIAPPIESPMQ
jgi:hypothetical protein